MGPHISGVVVWVAPELHRWGLLIFAITFFWRFTGVILMLEIIFFQVKFSYTRLVKEAQSSYFIECWWPSVRAQKDHFVTMALSFDQWLVTVVSVMFAPVVIIFWLAVVLAAVGKSFGVTTFYTRILLLIFEVNTFFFCFQSFSPIVGLFPHLHFPPWLFTHVISGKISW